MRVNVEGTVPPPNMAGAWRLNAHAATLAARLDTVQLVSAVFSMRPRPLVQGEVLHTQAGRFQVETIDEGPGVSLVVLLTDAPGLEARLGITAEAGDGGCDVMLWTSVHPRSSVGRIYFRLIEPFHHLLMEQLLLRRLRRVALRLARSHVS
ncbi:MAG TPA: DUF2867 domain-containing protein [Dehalococcoidia bacterium]|nr:DUF2867 domain-containing protein [Dehalococcoidia bacterium]